MHRKHLYFFLLTLAASSSAFAQDVTLLNSERKWAGELDELIEGSAATRVQAKGEKVISASELLDLTVNVSDGSDEIAEALAEEGFETFVISDNCLTAKIPASMVPVLVERYENVTYVSAPREFFPLMDNTREANGVDDIHDGTELDTPYTGAGVVVGVIDQGFQYNHIAYKDRASYWTGLKFSTSLPTSGDSYSTSSHSHATHVTNIAAGGVVSGSDLYGIAYGSEVLMASSSFSDSDVLRQAKAIKSYAEDAGMPWVINMSFGSQTGPHDGTTTLDQNMAALCGEGGIMVGAMGNEAGEEVHVLAEFDEDDQVKSLYIKPASGNTDKGFVLDLWSTVADGEKNLDIQPLIVTSTKTYTPTTSQIRSSLSYTHEVNSLNNKQHYYLNGYMKNLASTLGVTASTYYLVIQVTGSTGQGYHAWLGVGSDDAECEFGPSVTSISSYNIQRGDDEYLVSEGGASIPTAVAVGSYNVATTYKNLKGTTYSVNTGNKGAISNFSSAGPSVDETAIKPAVLAPGSAIKSAFNSTDEAVSSTASDVVESVTSGSTTYYYGAMSGTSMATPSVTGTIALWLEANPSLDYEDILTILRETSTRDSYTGDADDTGWNVNAGYGKLNAYEGLKYALDLANSTGISQAVNTSGPVSLSKGQSEWKVLFNNDEQVAKIEIYALNGQQVYGQNVIGATRGEELVIDLEGFAPGVYVFSVQTTSGTLTRKIVR